MNKINRLTILTLCILTALTAFCASVKISIRSSRGGQIHVGDRFIVTVRTDNVNGQPRSFRVPGATSDQFTSTSQSMVSTISGNGMAETHMSGEYKMLCRAETPGKYTLGPIVIGGVKSNSVSYTIAGGQNPNSGAGASPGTPGAPSSSGPTFIGKGNGNLFMRASVSKTTAYEQEALVYTVKLYCSFSRIKFIGATASPKFDGFVVEESKQTDQQLRMETLDGRNYATAIIARYIIFPQMTGNLKVTGNTYTVSVDEREYYHDSTWGQLSVSRPIQLNVTPNDLSVNVKALPQPKPADFSGGVGKFSITSSMPSTDLRTGETASIKYVVSGTGNLKYVTLPELANVYPKQIEVYSPQTDVQSSVTGSSVTGKVVFDYSLMPDEEGEYKIPDVTLVYFNPETGSYERSVAKGYTVKVGKGSGASAKSKQRNAVFDQKLMKAGTDTDNTPMVYTFAYWLFYIIPVVLLVVIIICYRKYIKANADLSAVMSRRANKMAQKRLRKAAVCMQKNDFEHFYDEMLFALFGYISYKMKMPNSELTRDNISEVLLNGGVKEETVSKFISLLDSCEFAKYTPGTEQTESMKSIYNKGVEIINELEQSFKKAKNEK